MDARTNAGETSDCDLVYVWVQKASAFLAWWRKVQNVELTLAKARVYNATGEFDISSLIRLKERFYALLKRRVGILATGLAIEDRWNSSYGVMGDGMMRKIALKVGAYAKDRARGSDILWNVSSCAPWFGKGKREQSLDREILIELVDVLSVCRKLEVMVWASRGECPGWKSNLLEDMKDAIWLMLKGELYETEIDELDGGEMQKSQVETRNENLTLMEAGDRVAAELTGERREPSLGKLRDIRRKLEKSLLETMPHSQQGSNANGEAFRGEVSKQVQRARLLRRQNAILELAGADETGRFSHDQRVNVALGDTGDRDRGYESKQSDDEDSDDTVDASNGASTVA